MKLISAWEKSEAQETSFAYVQDLPQATEVKYYLKSYNSLERNDYGAQPSPFQVLLDIVVAVELGQVDEHACGTAPVPPAAVAAVAHPTTRRTDPGLQGGECGRGGKGKP